MHLSGFYAKRSDEKYQGRDQGLSCKFEEAWREGANKEERKGAKGECMFKIMNYMPSILLVFSKKVFASSIRSLALPSEKVIP